MRTFPYIALSLVLTAGLSGAATFTVDFDDSAYPIPGEGGDEAPSINGIDGWTESVSPLLADDRYTWISTSFGLGNSLTYGGYFSSLPPSFSVGRTFDGLASGGKSLSFQSHITDTVPFDPLYPTIFGRDTFGFQIKDGDGDLLLTVNLVPANQDYVVSGDEASGYLPGLWTVYYAFGLDDLQTDDNALQSTGVNFFTVDFGESGLTFNYGQGSGPGHTVDGTADGYDVNDTEIDLSFTYERSNLPDEEYTGGENHIRIDNISVIDGIPEPTTAALAALGSLALLRRRRVQ